MLKWAMSKIENIKKLVAEGKGSLKMINYLLWYISSVEEEAEIRKLCSDKSAPSAHIYFVAANMIASHRRDVDKGEMTVKEYEEWREVARKNLHPEVLK